MDTHHEQAAGDPSRAFPSRWTGPPVVRSRAYLLPELVYLVLVLGLLFALGSCVGARTDQLDRSTSAKVAELQSALDELRAGEGSEEENALRAEVLRVRAELLELQRARPEALRGDTEDSLLDGLLALAALLLTGGGSALAVNVHRNRTRGDQLERLGSRLARLETELGTR